MTNGSSHIDGEGEAAIGVAASPLRSGRRLGCFSWISEKFPMKDDGGADVSSRSLFLRIEHPEMYLSASGRQNPGVPVSTSGIEIGTLYPTKLSRMGKAVIGIVAICRRPEIAGAVIRWIAVNVVKNARDFIEANSMMKSVNDAVKTLGCATDPNPDITPGTYGASFGASVSSVPPLSRVLIFEMIHSPEFPAQDAGCFVKLKHF